MAVAAAQAALDVALVATAQLLTDNRVANLRPEQTSVVKALLRMLDVCAVLRTGFGKTLCIVVAAIHLAVTPRPMGERGVRICYVIVPTKALRQNMCMELVDMGLAVAQLREAGDREEEENDVTAILHAHEASHVVKDARQRVTFGAWRSRGGGAIVVCRGMCCYVQLS